MATKVIIQISTASSFYAPQHKGSRLLSESWWGGGQNSEALDSKSGIDIVTKCHHMAPNTNMKTCISIIFHRKYFTVFIEMEHDISGYKT